MQPIDVTRTTNRCISFEDPTGHCKNIVEFIPKNTCISNCRQRGVQLLQHVILTLTKDPKNLCMVSGVLLKFFLVAVHAVVKQH